MGITLHYENVPHFCFNCGRIGHAALSCTLEVPVDQGVRFKDELQASPPRRVREIIVKRTPSRATRQLFQVDTHPKYSDQYGSEKEHAQAGHVMSSSSSKEGNPREWCAGLHKEGSDDVEAATLAGSVKELHVACGSRNTRCGSAKGKRKDRV
jgi:hypothetical protein